MKRTMKKLLSLVLALGVILGVMSVGAFATEGEALPASAVQVVKQGGDCLCQRGYYQQDH